ncbi:MAG TPA: SGNH/GDSL hydrolase family protein [Candidatus Polarisedimenticolaceae bacterium]
MSDRPARARPDGLVGRLLRAARTAVAIALSVLALLEIVARLTDPAGISYYAETARYMDTLIRDEPMGYRNRPGLRGRFFGAPVEINALGMRDRELARDPADGEFRVAILGDSFPFGIGVPYEESVPAQMERALAAVAPPGVHVRTLNFGVPSYNTEQELAQFETVVAPLRPRAVALFFALNDIYPRMWVFEKRASRVTNLAQRSYAVALLYVLGRRLRPSQADPGTSMATEYRSDHPRWQAIDRSLTALHAKCRQAGIPFVVFTYDDRQREAMAMVAAVGSREGFPVLPIDPWRDARWKGEDPRAYVNSPVDSHPNREGCVIYGTLAAEGLIRAGVFRDPPAADVP